MAVLDESYTINNAYFNGRSYVDWLESFTIDERVEVGRRLEYHKLIHTLWTIDFVPSIGNDLDRSMDGLELRNRYNDIFMKKSGAGEFYTPSIDDIFGDCRVLEMLIALSMRMYDLMQDLGVYNSVSRWFWEIMECIGLDIFDDDNWGESGSVEAYNSEQYVKDICESIMYQTRDLHGRKGGWFAIRDWEKLEIWYQMHQYLKAYIFESR